LRIGFRVFQPVRSVEDVSEGRIDKSRGAFRLSLPRRDETAAREEEGRNGTTEGEERQGAIERKRERGRETFSREVAIRGEGAVLSLRVVLSFSSFEKRPSREWKLQEEASPFTGHRFFALALLIDVFASLRSD